MLTKYHHRLNCRCAMTYSKTSLRSISVTAITVAHVNTVIKVCLYIPKPSPTNVDHFVKGDGRSRLIFDGDGAETCKPAFNIHATRSKVNSLSL